MLRRKEFAAFTVRDDDPTKDTLHKQGLMLTGSQMHATMVMNPHTPNMRFLLKRSTGTGKTATTLAIAKRFIDSFIIMREHDGAAPAVFVLGFTTSAFREELLRRPELGAITPVKHRELERLRKLAESGIATNVAKYHEFKAYLKREQTDARLGGYYKFYGYQEFVNRLFTFTKDTTAGVVTSAGVAAAIAAGDIKVNESLVKSMENSLMICDEIHDVYNTLEANNYGIAIQYVLDNVPGLRAIFASATVINNSPAEVIDLVRLIVPKDILADRLAKFGFKGLQRDDFFSGKRLKPGAADKLGLLTRGFVSSISNVDTYDFPTRTFKGSEFKYVKGGVVSTLPIGVIRCQMSPEHLAAADNAQLPADTDVASDARSSSTFDLYALRDMVFPMPSASPSHGREKTSFSPSLFPSPRSGREKEASSFRYSDVKAAVSAAGNAGTYIRLVRDATHVTFTGDFLRANEIGKWSSKYHTLLNMLDALLADRTSGKIMLYHNFVVSSGVLLIRELLLQNGFLGETGSPTDTTKCAVCGVTMAKHKAGSTPMFDERIKDGVVDPPVASHAFSPARVITIIGEINESMRTTYKMYFNQPQNTWGEMYKVILVSQVFTQSHEVFAVQHVMLLSLPFNVPTMIQVVGRANRKGSHKLLPPDHRNVNIYVLMTSRSDVSRTGKPTPEGMLSREELAYIDKFEDFADIKLIDQKINENVIDPMFHEEKPNPDALDPLPYKSRDTVPSTGITTATFEAFGAYKYEVSVCIWMIKDLFLRYSPVWTYDDLLAKVRNPPFWMEYKCDMISEPNFAIALTFLTRDVQGLKANIEQDRFIVKNGRMLHIMHIGKFFILTHTRHVTYDSFDRGVSRSEMVTLTSEQIIDTVHGGFFDAQYAKYIETFGGIRTPTRSPPLRLVWGDHDARFFTTMWRRFIEKSLVVPAFLISIFDSFGVFVRDERKDGYPMGYKEFRRQHILRKFGWETTPLQLDSIPENGTIGFYAPTFKIRLARSTQKTSDRRLVKRGLLCQSHSPAELKAVATSLGVATPEAGAARGIKPLCVQIEERLLALELDQRKHVRSVGRIRYVYLPTEAIISN